MQLRDRSTHKQSCGSHIWTYRYIHRYLWTYTYLLPGVDESRSSVKLQLHVPRIHSPCIRKIVKKWSLMRSQARQRWPGAGHSQTRVLVTHKCLLLSTLPLPLHIHSCPGHLDPSHSPCPWIAIKSLVPPLNVLPQHHTVSHTHPTGSEPVSLKSILESLFLWLFISPCGWEFPVTAWEGSHFSLVYWDSLLCHFAQGHLTQCTSVVLPAFPEGCCCYSDHVQDGKSSQDLPSIRRTE